MDDSARLSLLQAGKQKHCLSGSSECFHRCSAVRAIPVQSRVLAASAETDLSSKIRPGTELVGSSVDSFALELCAHNCLPSVNFVPKR